MTKSMQILIMGITVVSMLFGQWQIPVKLYPTSEDSVYYPKLYFGQAVGASDSFDPFIDELAPPPPMFGFYAYFQGDSTSGLIKDFRANIDTGIAVLNLWQLRFRDEAGESVWVVWDADSFPYSLTFPRFFKFIVSDSIPDDIMWETATSITATDSIFVAVEKSVFFRYRDWTRIFEPPSLPQNLYIEIIPNPFNSSCRISLVGVTNVDIAIIDISGRLVDEVFVKGSIIFYPNSIPGGLYFAIIKGSNYTKPIIYVK